MVSAESVVEVKVSKPFGESSIARILELVQHASARKAPTELFIRKFARVYTPIVVLLAVLLVVVCRRFLCRTTCSGTGFTAP